MIDLFPHQTEAIGLLRSGNILCGGVGSGKTITSLSYFFYKECFGKFVDGIPSMMKPKDLYVITTAQKRDSLDWQEEALSFPFSRTRDGSVGNIIMIVDSWNNIAKYKRIKNAFFIFDEQRLVGSGKWVKSFIEIAKENRWILLSATPGDTWLDYVPVFIANGFYKNRTEFIRQHVVFNNFSNFPKIDHYVETNRLNRLRNEITVVMNYSRERKTIKKNIFVGFDIEEFSQVFKERWNPFEDEPIKNVSSFYSLMRRVTNTHSTRIHAILDLLKTHDRLIIFYNFDYELDMLRKLKDVGGFDVAEYNGHIHDDVPTSQRWIYLVQYLAGSEGWNCITTNVIVFYSLNYSYRIMTQASGRIDRINTPFNELYNYTLLSSSYIDTAIQKSLSAKKNFNESKKLFIEGVNNIN